MLIVCLAIFIILLIIGSPIFIALGVSGAITNRLFINIPGTVLPQSFFSSIDSWVLLACPFFLLAGNIMGKCGPADSLFDLCDKLVGHMRGGLPTAVVLACVMFGAITGSGVATVVAIGSIAIPEMLKMGYDKKFCFGLVVASGTLGLMIPPSIYMILFASMVQGDVIEFFTAGYLPGFLIAIILIAVAVKKSPVVKVEVASWQERWKSFLKAAPALSMPVVIMGSIYSGIFTPTESAALSAIYALGISKIFYKKVFNYQSFIESARDAVSTTCIIFIILGAVTAFSGILTFLHIPQEITQFAVQNKNLSANTILAIIVGVYFLFGMIIDPVPILYLTLPIFFPVVKALGINITHFMIITITCMMIAQITPPFGMALFALSGQFKEKLEVIVSGMIPFLIAMIIAVALLIIFPQISLFLPQLLLK